LKEEEIGQEIEIDKRDAKRKANKKLKEEEISEKNNQKMENGEQGGSKGRGQGGTKNCFSRTLLPTLSYLTSETHLAEICICTYYICIIYI
jgi:hypothetical protein